MRRILVTVITLDGRSGTGTHVLDLVREWRRRGHQVGVLTRRPSGPLVEEITGLGAEVVDRPRSLSFVPDLIHGHHTLMVAIASAAFPDVPVIYVCHDAAAASDHAPRLPRAVLYAAVDELCRKRVADDAGLPVERVMVVGNAVDLRLFRPRPPLPARPRRALVFSNYASEANFLPAVRAACRLADMELAVVGTASGQPSATPWLELPKADLVFAKARCAMEAMATGCAVVLCGVEGAGPLVTTENFSGLKRWNFGRHCLTDPTSTAVLAAAIAEYDARDANATGALARAQLGLTAFGETWEALHLRVLQAPTPLFPACGNLALPKLILELRLRQGVHWAVRHGWRAVKLVFPGGRRVAMSFLRIPVLGTWPARLIYGAQHRWITGAGRPDRPP